MKGSVSADEFWRAVAKEMSDNGVRMLDVSITLNDSSETVPFVIIQGTSEEIFNEEG